MSVGSVLIGLQASRNDGLGVTAQQFLVPLSIQPDEVEAAWARGGAWESGMVELAIVRFSDFDHVDTTDDAGAQSEAFYAGIIEAFREAGRFLDGRSPQVTATMRLAGLALRLFVDVRMDQDQMEVEFPPEFLAACGRHNLSIYLISNDISAAEVLAAREMGQS
jgi:hypothetical protein